MGRKRPLPHRNHMDAGHPALELVQTEKSIHAIVLNKIGGALEWTELADRQPGAKQIREGGCLRRLPHGPSCCRR